ncbi:hypothetical protein O181_015395 [Austropuccinia psidii MF-1]|uniref:Uncharacterized protein n=1 Tax=Austropuccinia psidii MF-1 TaxID=1389203 RepID=A0A9Q3C3V2_9BASI|nr:hypothetical protein [Austropuccinia psidii MF-1]
MLEDSFQLVVDSEGSDELYGEEVEVVNNPVGHQSRTSPSQPPSKRFKSCLIPSTPRNFQPILATIPTSLSHSSPSSSHTRPAINPEASSSRRREELSPLPFPASKVCQQRDHWPIQATREDPNTASESQDAVARLFRQVDRISREGEIYTNDRTIPGTASEEIAAKFAWYEDELINDFQRNFDHMGRNN